MAQTCLYPNPVRDDLAVNAAQAGMLVLTDLTGRVMLQRDLRSGQQTVSVARLAAGVYLYRIIGTAGALLEQGKITKE